MIHVPKHIHACIVLTYLDTPFINRTVYQPYCGWFQIPAPSTGLLKPYQLAQQFATIHHLPSGKGTQL